MTDGPIAASPLPWPSQLDDALTYMKLACLLTWQTHSLNPTVMIECRSSLQVIAA